MKVLQTKVRRLKLFGCSLKPLANGQCTSTKKRSVLLIPASYFTDLEKKEYKCLKKSTVFILHFAPSLRFTLSLQSAFYPWSAVCSQQSAFYTDRLVYTCQYYMQKRHWSQHFNMALVRCNVLLISKFNSPIFLFTWLFCTAITTICIFLIIIFIIIYQQATSLCSHNLYKSTGSYIQLSMCWPFPFSFFLFFCLS